VSEALPLNFSLFIPQSSYDGTNVQCTRRAFNKASFKATPVYRLATQSGNGGLPRRLLQSLCDLSFTRRATATVAHQSSDRHWDWEVINDVISFDSGPSTILSVVDGNVHFLVSSFTERLAFGNRIHSILDIHTQHNTREGQH
jgi:hypothetical protein